MADDVTAADKPLTTEEVQKALLHMAASLHNLQVSMEDTIRRFGVGGPGIVRPGEKALNLSRLELAEVLKIIAKDPNDG